MSWIERMLEERLARAAENGELDPGPLAGKPIPDLDDRRPQGWWANRFVERELSHDRRQRSINAAAAARATFWRAVTIGELHERVRLANAAIVRANLNLVETDRLELFDPADIEQRWRDLVR